MNEAISSADVYKFFCSCDIDNQVTFRVERLIGSFTPLGHEHAGDLGRTSALYAVAELCSSGKAITLSCQTPFADSGGPEATWNAALLFPIKYRDLLHDTQLAITIWEKAEGHAERVLGGTTCRLFSRKGRLKTGYQQLRLWLHRTADVNCPSGTLGKVPKASRGEFGRLENVYKRYERGELTHVSWLDANAGLTKTKMLQLRQKELEENLKRGWVMLEVEFAGFPHAVIYHQARSNPGPGPTPQLRPSQDPHGAPTQSLILFQDPEVGWDNPSEKKAQKLARSATRGLVDHDLKPDTEEKRRILALLQFPPNRPLSSVDRGMLWRFRWSLTGDKRALTKVLQCVDWGDAHEARQAVDLIAHWAPIDVADALELLSPAFTHFEVRGHAVEVLKKTEDEELRYYLLQLVQALRYEAQDDSKLANFLAQRGSRNPTIGILIHWYLYTEWYDPTFGPRAVFIMSKMSAAEDSSTKGMLDSISLQMGLLAQLRHIANELKGQRTAVKKAEKLREMLQDDGQCGQLRELCCPLPLDPSVQLAGVIPQDCSVFKSALTPLRLTFRTAGPDGGALPSCAKVLSGASQASEVPLTDAPAASNPPGEGGRYMVIYKRGDDLRQDQLVVQMFSLMDRLLKRENLDLKLTPYRVLPTTPEDGLIECVPSTALARVLADHKTIHKFLALSNPDPAGPFGLKAEVVDAFVRSCAGYCVMTYILGVGDRHLDNLMLCSDGRLFHIDFGFIMGRDPKPFPPPMKLCREMIDAMGGAESEFYRKFRTLACEAYNILRGSASLLISLFHLMAGASIPDVRSDPDTALLKLQEKLRLDVDEETAVEWMQQLINESSTALMPAIMEQGHRLAQYWR